jgi:thiol-disulfide isomerase/thioredoxin
MKRLLIILLLVASPLKAEIYDIGQLNLEDFKGKVIYLDFWASWCKPCQKSFPWMNSLVAKYPAAKFKLITINLDAESAAMHQFLDKVPADFDIYHDPSGAIAEKFEIVGMPTSYLFDSNGKIIKKHIGFSTNRIETYQQEIEDLL